MRLRRFLIAAGVLALAAPLSGCVAAAIPVVAGGALVRTGTDGKDAKVSAETAAKASAARSPARSTRDLSRDDARLLAGSAPSSLSLSNAKRGYMVEGFADFLSFARDTAAAVPDEAPRKSALLADPASLSGERKFCSQGPPVVLIELDPPGGMLPVQPILQADRTLADRLEGLRQYGMEIAWISGQSAAHADAVREALTTAALDPESRDTLLLMRYPGDRKQTRREGLARRACLLAIAGDEREDFDELYAYLVNPEAALRLENLIGDGWFLVPPLHSSDQRPTQ